MGTPVTIVDYGSGNLFSVTRALECCDGVPTVTHDADGIESAERLVLPGVGAFADGMRGLRERGLIEPIRRFAASGRPLLGICLGMQMLAVSSEEFGHHEGLAILPGRVVPIPAKDIDDTPQKIPHIGWADLLPWHGDAWRNGVIVGTPENTAVYLVHSYHFVPERERDGLAVCMYGGHRLTAAVQNDHVVGFQFHPEKSGVAGLRLLSAFLAM